LGGGGAPPPKQAGRWTDRQRWIDGWRDR
jgi:hypothetical protein